MSDIQKKEVWLAVISLFASVSTLFCCALPAFLVTLGMGAVVAGVVSNFPALIWLSENKTAVFIIAGVLLIVSGFLRLRAARKATCPVDPVKAKACAMLKKISGIIYWIAAVFYIIGFFFAFLSAKLFL